MHKIYVSLKKLLEKCQTNHTFQKSWKIALLSFLLWAQDWFLCSTQKKTLVRHGHLCVHVAIESRVPTQTGIFHCCKVKLIFLISKIIFMKTKAGQGWWNQGGRTWSLFSASWRKNVLISFREDPHLTVE